MTRVLTPALRAKLRVGTDEELARLRGAEGGRPYRGFLIVEKRDFGGQGHFIDGFYVKHGYLALDKHGTLALPAATWGQTPRAVMRMVDDWIASGGNSDRFWERVHARTERERPFGIREADRALERTIQKLQGDVDAGKKLRGKASR